MAGEMENDIKNKSSISFIDLAKFRKLIKCYIDRVILFYMIVLGSNLLAIKYCFMVNLYYRPPKNFENKSCNDCQLVPRKWHALFH